MKFKGGDEQVLATQNELLRRDLNQELQKRADELEKIELRLRLQVSEELRRLPPREVDYLN